MKSRGFTLVELLVVTSILGLLAGLLFPAVQAAREAARGAECRHNLHQIGIDLIQRSDNRGRLPHFLFGAAAHLRCPTAVAIYGDDRDMFGDQGHYLQLYWGVTREWILDDRQAVLDKQPFYPGKEFASSVNTSLLIERTPLHNDVGYALLLDGHVSAISDR